jgi:nucleotide-binding universal stress UspA family protein
MVALDGSPSSEFALELAGSLALATGASVELVSVVPIHVYYSNYVPDVNTVTEAEEKAVHDRLEKDMEKLRSRGVRDVRFTVLSGLVVEALLDHVQAHPPELLIMGSRGQSTTRRLLLGSVSDALVHYANCPVLVAKLPPNPAPTKG